MRAEPFTAAEILEARAEAGALAVALKGLTPSSGRTAASPFEGVHSQKRSGVGETFWQFRPYMPGEPAQTIDWRQSARADHPLVREHEWQAARAYWFWLDGSASLRFSGSKDRTTKRGRGLVLLLALATWAVARGERVGLLGLQDRPISGAGAMDRLCFALEGADLPTLGGAVTRSALQPYARLTLVSDFLVPPEEIGDALRRLDHAKPGVLALSVLDPVEVGLPFAGRVRFEGLEDEAPALIDHVETSRPSYAEALAAHDAAVKDALRRRGGTVVGHLTDAPAMRGLLDLLPSLGLAAA